MAAADALSKYLQRVRFWFPKGFSKYFYETKGKTEEEIRELDNTLKDELLSGVQQDAIRLQRGNKRLTYWRLIRGLGWPLILALELILENLPEEEFARYEKKKRLIVNTCVSAVLLSSFLFVGYVSMVQSEPVREVKTLVVKRDNTLPPINETKTVIKLFENKGDDIE